METLAQRYVGIGYLSIRISKVSLVTVVDGDQKAPFSITTTPRRRGGRYSFPWIAPLYPRTYLILLSVKQ